MISNVYYRIARVLLNRMGDALRGGGTCGARLEDVHGCVGGDDDLLDQRERFPLLQVEYGFAFYWGHGVSRPSTRSETAGASVLDSPEAKVL